MCTTILYHILPLRSQVGTSRLVSADIAFDRVRVEPLCSISRLRSSLVPGRALLRVDQRSSSFNSVPDCVTRRCCHVLDGTLTRRDQRAVVLVAGGQYQPAPTSSVGTGRRRTSLHDDVDGCRYSSTSNVSAAYSFTRLS